jgi:hypothetical protein
LFKGEEDSRLAQNSNLFISELTLNADYFASLDAGVVIDLQYEIIYDGGNLVPSMTHDVQFIFQTCEVEGELARFIPKYHANDTEVLPINGMVSEQLEIIELLQPAGPQIWNMFDYIYLETSDEACRPRKIVMRQLSVDNH